MKYDDYIYENPNITINIMLDDKIVQAMVHPSYIDDYKFGARNIRVIYPIYKDSRGFDFYYIKGAPYGFQNARVVPVHLDFGPADKFAFYRA